MDDPYPDAEDFDREIERLRRSFAGVAALPHGVRLLEWVRDSRPASFGFGEAWKAIGEDVEFSHVVWAFAAIVGSGTFPLTAGMMIEEPAGELVRVPEGWWAAAERDGRAVHPVTGAEVPRPSEAVYPYLFVGDSNRHGPDASPFPEGGSSSGIEPTRRSP